MNTTIDSAVVENSDLALTTTSTDARVDSRLLAIHLGNKHRHVMALIDRYVEKFKRINHMSFKNACGERKQGGGTVERYALLTEDQAYLLLALSRNNTRIVNLKVKLIQVFGEYRRAAELRHAEYLPSYRQLQNAIHSVASGSPNESWVHRNVAKLVNKTAGLDVGQRKSVQTPQMAKLIVAQEAAAYAFLSAQDHHAGYQQTKQAMVALEVAFNQNVPVRRRLSQHALNLPLSGGQL